MAGCAGCESVSGRPAAIDMGHRPIMPNLRLRSLCLAIMLGSAFAPGSLAAQSPQHGLAMIGAPRLERGASPAYANPHAPQGGRLARAILGSYDSLNPFSVRGVPAADLTRYVFQSLMLRHYDEPFSLYGQIAESAVREADGRALRFRLRAQARFSDGQPVTAADVAFSLKRLAAEGRPNHRFYYSKVARVEILSRHEIRFHFAPEARDDRELPLIVGLMPILPKHVYETRDIRAPSLAVPIGSGPYVVAETEAGRRFVLRKIPDWWGQDLPFNRGRYNFAQLDYQYFRDANSAFAAFTKGELDFWSEQDATRWTQGFDIPAYRRGAVRKAAIATRLPSGLQGFVFNTRRAALADARTRAALSLLFAPARTNRLLYGGVKARTRSYFGGTPLSAWQQPASAAERAILRRASFSDSVWAGQFAPPAQDRRARLKTAQSLLAAAGWEIRDGRFYQRASDEPLALEILVRRREDERLALLYAADARRAGVQLRVRFADEVQYQNRLRQFDYDMIVHGWYASLSPGNEQAFYWGSEAADTPGSRNYAGVKEDFVDDSIAALLAAASQTEFVAAARSLDRALMAGHYVIPLFHQPAQWTAWWDARLGHPDRHSRYGRQLDFWWRKPAR